MEKKATIELRIFIVFLHDKLDCVVIVNEIIKKLFICRHIVAVMDVTVSDANHFLIKGVNCLY